MAGDLFATPLIEGLVYREDYLSQAEHDRLVTILGSLDLSPFRFHGWFGNRKTRTYGWSYDFDDASFTPSDPIPEWLLPLRLKAAELAGVDAQEFAHVLIARYDPGAGIGWHRDRPQFEHVVGFSFASAAIMRFRQRTSEGFRRVNAPLEPRSTYLLSGAARWDWEHSIAAGNELRFSVTFRTLSQIGRRTAAQQR